MDAICTVKKNDVRDCVVAMQEGGQRGDLIQTSGPKYVSLEKAMHMVPGMHAAVEKQFKYVIDMKTATLHETGCDQCGDDKIKARLINVKSSGLEVCSCVK